MKAFRSLRLVSGVTAAAGAVSMVVGPAAITATISPVSRADSAVVVLVEDWPWNGGNRITEPAATATHDGSDDWPW